MHRCPCAFRGYCKGANRLFDILDLLDTKVSERKGQYFPDLIVGRAGDAGAARTGEGLQPAAMFTPSPKRSPPLTMTSPTWMPIRMLM